MKKYSETAKVRAWGANWGARQVTRLTADERAAVRAGQELRIAGCPEYRGETDRRVIAIGSRFYARMPA